MVESVNKLQVCLFYFKCFTDILNSTLQSILVFVVYPLAISMHVFYRTRTCSNTMPRCCIISMHTISFVTHTEAPSIYRQCGLADIV